MFCGKCGRKLNDNALFCPACGTKTALNKEIPEIKVDEPEPLYVRDEALSDVAGSEKKEVKKSRKGIVIAVVALIVVIILIVIAVVFIVSQQKRDEYADAVVLSDTTEEQVEEVSTNDASIASDDAVGSVDQGTVATEADTTVTMDNATTNDAATDSDEYLDSTDAVTDEATSAVSQREILDSFLDGEIEYRINENSTPMTWQEMQDEYGFSNKEYLDVDNDGEEELYLSGSMSNAIVLDVVDGEIVELCSD